jgi:hypothetical protein
MIRILLPVTVLASVLGCASTRPESEVNRGREAVVAALDGWKGNRPAESLKARPEPVDFTEELRKNYTLVEYTLGNVDSSDKDVIRYAVTLKLKDRKGTVTEREVVYAVALKSPVVVARDPYY